MDSTSINPDDIKLIVSDVDGTLLNSHHRLHPRTRSAILHLRKTRPDLPFIIATGKPYAALAEVREELNLSDFPCIHLNGCMVYGPGGSMMRQDALDSTVVLQMVDMLRPMNKSTYLYVQDEVFEVIKDPVGRNGKAWLDVLRGFGEDVKPAPDGILDHVREGQVKVQKVVVLADEKDVPDIRKKLSAFPPDACSQTSALSYAIELICSTSSKELALQTLIDSLDVTPQNVLAFGDGENDAGMLALAGHGVAMANAMHMAKKRAKYTTGTNDDGGVGMFLEEVFNIEPVTDSRNPTLN
ncbi:hypothetical protein SpCBS45565_g00711 [Spizellomyces sp. 'palustris']|nr:hypothetical protein SpCBS45565_g00711 [Spizellomyces sp. 'palustris']